MSLAEDFVTYLKTQSTITDVVSHRIIQAPVRVDEATPFIGFRRSARNEQVDLGGTGGLVETTLDVECVGRTLDEAEDLSDALHSLLNGTRATWGSRTIDGVFVNDQSDDYEYMFDGADLTQIAVASAVRIFHR